MTKSLAYLYSEKTLRSGNIFHCVCVCVCLYRYIYVLCIIGVHGFCSYKNMGQFSIAVYEV